MFTNVPVSDGKPYVWGQLVQKPLYEFIQTIPQWLLNDYGMIVTNPIDIRNTIAGFMKYTPDWKVHGTSEHWITNLNDMAKFLEDPRDDCDGAAIVVASWLHTIGNPNVRICVGGFRENVLNHMWAGIVVGNDMQILESSGDKIIEELPLLSESPNYYLHYSASAFTGGVYTHV